MSLAEICPESTGGWEVSPGARPDWHVDEEATFGPAVIPTPHGHLGSAATSSVRTTSDDPGAPRPFPC